jgi:hypothetical protein
VRFLGVDAVAGGCGDDVEAGYVQNGNTLGLLPDAELFPRSTR